MGERILKIDQRLTKRRADYSARSRTAKQKEGPGNLPVGTQPQRSSENTIEILVEGQECPFCHFAKLEREGDEIVCPICGYGHKPCT